MKVKEVKVGKVIVGGSRPFVLIAGPCVIESEASAMRHAEKLVAIARKAGVGFIFKSSYDKANRTSLASFRGPGLKSGLRTLARVRREFGIPVLSDVHSVEDVGPAGDVLDCLQIPAFLSRQTDILIAAAKTEKVVNIKKGQFLAPWNMAEAARKVAASGNDRILLTERGASFGYNNLVVDFRALAIMRETGYPVVFDASHSVQLPGGQGTSSGGERRYVGALSRAALAFACDAVFLEVHERPEEAPCDGSNMIPLKELPALLAVLKDIDATVRHHKIR